MFKYIVLWTFARNSTKARDKRWVEAQDPGWTPSLLICASVYFLLVLGGLAGDMLRKPEREERAENHCRPSQVIPCIDNPTDAQLRKALK